MVATENKTQQHFDMCKAAGWVTSLVCVEAVSLTATGPASLGLLGAGVLEELASKHASSLGLGVRAEWEGLGVVPILAEVFLGEPCPLARGGGGSVVQLSGGLLVGHVDPSVCEFNLRVHGGGGDGHVLCQHLVVQGAAK